MSKEPRRTVDYEAFCRDYRAGTYPSNVTLGQAYGISESMVRKKIKQFGLERDLQADVKQLAAIKLQRQPSKDAPAPKAAGRSLTPDELVVEAAADVIVRVVHEHRAMLGETRELFNTLHGQLKEAIESRDELAATIDEMTKDDKSRARAARLMRSISMPKHVATLKDLTGVLGAVIKLEREAFGVDDKQDDDKDSLEKLLEGL